MPQTPDVANRIMHARLQVGDRLLTGGDSLRGQRPQGFRVSITVDHPAEADRIFDALSDGGDVMMPIGETFWARRFGMVTDNLGIPWMVNCDKPMA